MGADITPTDAASVFFLLTEDPSMQFSFKPLQGVRFTALIENVGLLTDPTGSVTATLYDPTSGAHVLNPVRDSTGSYHADYTFLATDMPGVWTRRWRTTNPDGMREDRFTLEALDAPP